MVVVSTKHSLALTRLLARLAADIPPEVARVAVAGIVHKSELGRVIEYDRESGMRVEQERRHARVVRLEARDRGGELAVEVGDDSCLRGCRGAALRRHLVKDTRR
jgi:hypothetical protein